ncbi:nuclease [Methanobrevibacter sp.]|uniref:nuclease n=1 Tax=Methanobrevibacter sp. TaxID=66852 RepID=UPI00388FBEA9
MFEDERDDKIYNLLITNGIDQNNEYGQFTEKLYSKVDFLWKESISGSYAAAGESFYQKIDRIIFLAGLYKDNKELFEVLLKAAEEYEIPIVLVRPMGLEEVPEVLEEKAATIVGWNANCIIDAIKDAQETM